MTAWATGHGRPLRFFGVVVGGWIGLRTVLLWPQLDSPAAVLRAFAPVPVAAAQAAPRGSERVARPTAIAAAQMSRRWHAAVASHPHRAPDPARVALGLLGLVRIGDPAPVGPAPVGPAPVGPAPIKDTTPLLPGLPRALPNDPAAHLPSRWSGSAWLVARSGGGSTAGGLGGQLGGSQAGLRLAYLFDRTRRIALAARVTTPLGRGLREAALGVEWQPTRLPVRLIAEQRFAIDGGRGGPALGLVGGVGPVALPLDLRLEAYGQAGIIHRGQSEAYADAAARIAHPLGHVGAVRFDLGAGAWGGAQRGAARLDLGPSLDLSLPLGKQRVRVSVDWRHRVAGSARPGSGAALTLGTDF